MEHASILLMLLTLSGWILHSDATNCTAYLSFQPLTLNLLCPSAVCRLELSHMRGCDSDCPSCNIADCNKVYNRCNISPSQKPSSTGNAAQSNEQHFNCTFVELPSSMEILVECQRGDVHLSSMSNNTACIGDLGINCNPNDPVGTCIEEYSFCTEPRPNTCTPWEEMVPTTVLNNQCTKSVTAQITYTKRVTVTVYSSIPIYTPVTVCPSSTASLTSQTIETTDVFSSTFFTNVTSYPSSTHSTISQTCSATPTVNRATIPAIGATVGLLVVLLIVVTMGWVYTCKRKIELKPQNISTATNLNLNNNPAYVTKTTCQTNPAYVVTDISTGEPDKSQAAINEIESTYEMVQPSSAQAKQRPGSQTGKDNQLEPTYETVQQSSAQMEKGSGSLKNEDDYDKLDREIPLPSTEGNPI